LPIEPLKAMETKKTSCGERQTKSVSFIYMKRSHTQTKQAREKKAAVGRHPI